MKLLNVAGGFWFGVGLGLVSLVAWLIWMANKEKDEEGSYDPPDL